MNEKLIRELVRDILSEKLIQENKLKNALAWIKKKGRPGFEAVKKFLINLKQELSETKDGMIILAKMVSRKRLTPDEMSALKQQMKDIAVGIPLLALFILPGGGVATVILVTMAEKSGIDLMPSSFQPENKNTTDV